MDNRSDADEVDFSGLQGENQAETCLWMRWREDGDLDARDCLIKDHTPFARMVAAMLYKNRFHDEVEFSDYFQMACLGLVEAVDRFDPKLGVAFKAFAIRRIRGAVLNSLDKVTEKNQQIAVQRRLRKNRLESVKGSLSTAASLGGNCASDDMEALFESLAEVGIGLALAVLLEGTLMISEGEESVVSAAASVEVEYFRRRDEIDLQIMLQAAMKKLRPKEKALIRLHYQQELCFEDISVIFGVSRSRVSQIHRKALFDLRQVLESTVRCDVSI